MHARSAVETTAEESVPGRVLAGTFWRRVALDPIKRLFSVVDTTSFIRSSGCGKKVSRNQHDMYEKSVFLGIKVVFLRLFIAFISQNKLICFPSITNKERQVSKKKHASAANAVLGHADSMALKN